MTVLAIVPCKPNMCLQENLVDCADCGGLKDYDRDQNNITILSLVILYN